MSGLLAAALTAGVVLVLSAQPTALAKQRLGGLGLHQPGMPEGGGMRTTVPSHRLAAAVAGLAVGLALGGLVGACAGVLVAAVLSRWLAGLEPRAVRQRRQRMEADLTVAADLLAACLLAGSPPADAAEAVAEALGGPIEEELLAVVANLRLGGDQAASWLRLAGEPVLAPLARSWARALETGAPLAEAMTRLADEQRSARRWAAEAGARRAGVRATAPLGLCFLPAFVLIGVVPAVVGIAADLLR
jgi:Flp pilus assembly protein TadB